jgi:hypothetical protein
MIDRRIIFVIRQPGTASAFIPLLKKLNYQDDIDVSILAFDLSHALLANAGLEFTKIENFNNALPYLDPDIDYLVTGTSEKVADDESFWKWANENQIPSLAFVDQWSNLVQRFDCQNLPSSIAVLDETAKKELEPYVARRCQILITGSPIFDALKETINTFRRSENRTRILFVLEPDISGMREDEIRNLHGFTEYDCLRAGFYAVSDYARRHDISLIFTLKPHPRDAQNRIQGLVEQLKSEGPNLPVDVWQGSKEEALCESDVVMGMRSMLLLEAAFVHKPVISIQLHRKTSCLLTDDRKYIRLAVTEREIRQHLEECLATTSSHVQPDNTEIQGFSAIERFVEILRG